MEFIKKVLKLTVLSVAMFTFGSYMVLKATQYHRTYLRDKVGSQVSMLVNPEIGGGTGFAIKAPSGKVYTLTNSHICELVDSKGYINTETNGMQVRIKMIKRSNKADLCLMENINGKTGLSLSDGLDAGEELAIVGHPNLYPLSLSRGEFLGYTKVTLAGYPQEDGTCPKNSQMAFTMFGPICLKQFDAGLTNAVALGGNSGSPVVNFWGNIVGVLFAGDNDSHWGVIVPLKDVKEFLKGM